MHSTQALILAGHGSHHNSRSAAPVYAHADRIRERGIFHAVRVGFWKEQPSLAEVLSTVDTELVYIVPLMTSEGYFTDRVFPRELGIVGGQIDGQEIRYTKPVGTHSGISTVVLTRAESVLASDIDEATVGIALVGHGTTRHHESATATVVQANRLRGIGRFATAEPFFLDQEPGIEDIPTTLEVDDIIVVPFFVADGVHVRQDVPARLGLPVEPDPFGGPTIIDGKRLWYTRAVGSAPALTDVILDRATEVGATDSSDATDRQRSLSNAEQSFLRWLQPGEDSSSDVPTTATTHIWGELLISVTSVGEDDLRYAVKHRDDRDASVTRLTRLQSFVELRERTRTNGAGAHRSLRTARTLPPGWVLDGLGPKALVRAIHAVYPASIDHWYEGRTGSLDVTGFESVVGRQAGRYRALCDVDSETLIATIEACCGDCVRRREWPARGLNPDPADGDFPCPEPCSFLLEAARSFALNEPTTSFIEEPTDPSIPAAAFDHPGNRYRIRFLRSVEHSGHTNEQSPLLQ